jgi:hypothetical protein
MTRTVDPVIAEIIISICNNRVDFMTQCLTTYPQTQTGRRICYSGLASR